MINKDRKEPSVKLNNDMNDWLLNPWANLLSSQGREIANFWKPAVDLQETDESYILEADIPGVPTKDIDVNIENNILSLSGTRQENKKEENATYTKIERFSGKFCRTFKLPTTVNVEKVKAKSENGVLKIILPKQESSKPKKIIIE